MQTLDKMIQYHKIKRNLLAQELEHQAIKLSEWLEADRMANDYTESKRYMEKVSKSIRSLQGINREIERLERIEEQAWTN